MGADCRIILPPGIRPEYIANAIGILAGCKKEQRPVSDFWVVEVAGAGVCATDTVGMGEIQIHAPGDKHASAYIHLGCGEWGETSISARSRGFWVAVGIALVDLFGGRVVASDCDDEETYRRPWCTGRDTDDDLNFNRFQRLLWDLAPLTSEQLQRGTKLSAYQVE